MFSKCLISCEYLSINIHNQCVDFVSQLEKKKGKPGALKLSLCARFGEGALLYISARGCFQDQPMSIYKFGQDVHISNDP